MNNIQVKRIYSKLSNFYFDAKKDFFYDNESLLKKQKLLNNFYKLQPKRNSCKICNSALPLNTIDFINHGVNYIFCESCGHLNGENDDTQAFIDKLYVAEDGDSYAKNYLDGDYLKRAENIYAPKVDFLMSNVNPGAILDIGCGGGYFVYAALKKGLDAIGVDVNKNMIDFGNNQIRLLLGSHPLELHGEGGLFGVIEKTNAQTISAIGVIEHLREPAKLFDSFRKSKAKYLFYSVPMFSMSVVFENFFENIFPRQLSGGHTHLFTEDSLVAMNELIGVQPLAEWRFGTDILDLYRSIKVATTEKGASRKFSKIIDSQFFANVDKIQAILDESHLCSEIHVLAVKK